MMGSPSTAAHASYAGDADKIVGTWKLRSVVYEDQQTKQRAPIYGARPIGYQLATPRGRWITVMTAQDRRIPQTDEERATALRTMVAYTGRYRIEHGNIIVKVEAAWQEAWVGSEQVRTYRFEGDDVLHLAGPPMPHPNLLSKVVRVIVTWERDDV